MTGPRCSIWDLHKEIHNLTTTDILRPRNYDKGPQWLQRRIRELPRSCDISTIAYRLCGLEYRALWCDMAKEHEKVVSTLIDASKSTGRGYDCLFNKAIKEMATFLALFATRAAPFSTIETTPFSGIDNHGQFELLMGNFGTVIDTLSIFYDRFDCELRSETLKLERDEKRMATFFCFEKNERPPPLDVSERWKVYEKIYGPLSSICYETDYQAYAYGKNPPSSSTFN